MEHGGLAAGVAALRSTGTPGSLVAGLDGGMVRLTGRLVEALREDGATVLRGVRVAALSRVPATGGWWAQISDRDDEVVRGLDVDRVVLAVDGVMRACGAEEYTSSYQFGKATGKENIQYASSTKPGNSDAKPTDKPAPDNKQ